MWPDPEETESEGGGHREGDSDSETEDSQSEPVTFNAFTKPKMGATLRGLAWSNFIVNQEGLIVSEETEEESSPPPSQPPPEEAPFTTPDLEEITRGAPPPTDDRD
jgi:hypothetical protein